MDRRPRRRPVTRRGHSGIPWLSPIKDITDGAFRRWHALNRKWRFAAATGVFTLAAITGYLILNPSEPRPRARQYLDFKACLLTDAQGVTGKQASPVWAGMGQASLKTRTQIQYLPVFGPATVPNTQPYLASLIQRHCNVIVGAGQVPATTIAGTAARYPQIRFIAVGAHSPARNLTSLNANDPAAPTTITHLITQAVRQHTT